MVSLWKTSRSGFGERHLTEGYAIEDFPSEEELADGCAYFAKDRWIAESFAGRRHYETWLIEVRIELDEYSTLFRGF